jgi:phosphatidylglycerophosphate synthase
MTAVDFSMPRRLAQNAPMRNDPDSPSLESDRRPIAARAWGPSRALTAWLASRGASPDAISGWGMVAGFSAGLAFAATAWWPEAARALFLVAAVLAPLRLLANMLDGMVAVARGVASARGALWNEVPDRVSDTAVLAGMGVAAGSAALGLGAALAAMLTAYVRATARAAGAPSDFSGPLAKQQRMAVAIVVALACAALPGQAVPMLSWALWFILAGSLFTAGRRLVRAARALDAAA